MSFTSGGPTTPSHISSKIDLDINSFHREAFQTRIYTQNEAQQPNKRKASTNCRKDKGKQLQEVKKTFCIFTVDENRWKVVTIFKFRGTNMWIL